MDRPLASIETNTDLTKELATRPAAEEPVAPTGLSLPAADRDPARGKTFVPSSAPDQSVPRSLVSRRLGLGLHYSERKLLLLVFDLFALSLALVLAVKLRTEMLDEPGAIAAYWYWFVTLALVWWVVSNLLETYDLARAAVGSQSVLIAGAAAAITALVYQWIPVFSPPLSSRKLVLLFAVLAVGLVSAWRGLYAILMVQPTFEKRAIVIGAGQSGRALVEVLAGVPRYGNPYSGSGYSVVGFVDDNSQLRGQYVENIPVLGGSGDLLRVIREQAIDEIVVAITNRETMTEQTFQAVLSCRELGIPVTTMPALYERLLGRVPVDHVGRDLTAVLPEEGLPGRRLFWLLKRIADLVLSLVGLPLLAILTLFVIGGNGLFSVGPTFYTQTRVGKGGRTFRVVKFRTMVPDAERSTGAIWSPEHDGRITPVGRVLRRTRFDEAPQILNVLRGEMSIIGPRPERPEFVDELAGVIPYYRARNAVRPGVTGWAQVRHGYGASLDDSRAKLEYDLYYVRHAGFYLDFLTLLKTLSVVFRLQGR